MSDEILDNTLNGNKLKGYCNMQGKDETSDEKYNIVASIVLDKCKNIEKIENIRNAYHNWVNMQNETIELLELLILEINIKFEKQRR